MPRINRKSESGFTLVELVIAIGISVIVMAGAMYVFNKQDKLFKQENAKTAARALARVAMNEMTKEIRRAGYGFPQGEGIVTISDTDFAFKGNTTRNPEVSSTIVADAADGATDITLATTAGFQAADKVVIFNAQATQLWETNTVSALTGTGLTLGTATGSEYLADRGIFIHKYHDLEYKLNGDKLQRRQDADLGGAWQTVISNVESLDFDYLKADGTTAATNGPGVAQINIDITVTDPESGWDGKMTMQTDVEIRNN